MRQLKFIDMLKHAIIYGIGGVAQSALGFVLLPVLTSKMSQSDYGVYSLVLMSATIANSIFYLGMTSAMPRSYFDYPKGAQRKAIFTTAFMVLIIGAFAQVVFGYGLAPTITRLLLQSDNSEYILAVKWAFFSGALTFTNQYFFTYLRLNRKSISSVLLSIVSLALGIGLTLLLLKLDSALLAPFQAIAITQALMGAVFVILYGKDMFAINIDLAESRKLLYFGVATILTSVGAMALDWADRIILERYASLADVGLYSAATRVASLMSVLLIVPFTQIWSTTMFEYRTHKDVKQFTSKILTYFLMAGGVLLLLMTLLSKDILGFLIRYETSAVLIMVFLILALGNLVYGTTNILVAGIFYERKIFLLTYIYIGVALVKIFLNIVLIPIFGIMAASINALLASILLPCSVYLVAKKYFSFSIEWVRLSKLTALIVIPIILVVCLFQYISSLEFFCLSTFLISIAIMFIYKICLFDDEKKYLGIFINKLGASIKGGCVNHEN